MDETPDPEEQTWTQIDVDEASMAHIERVSDRLRVPTETTLSMALGLLDWYLSFDGSDEKLLIEDADGELREPELCYSLLSEEGVTVEPILPSQRDA